MFQFILVSVTLKFDRKGIDHFTFLCPTIFLKSSKAVGIHLSLKEKSLGGGGTEWCTLDKGKKKLTVLAVIAILVLRTVTQREPQIIS